MDPIKNPFSPGAGAPPPELAGRDAIMEQARILFGRVSQKRPEKSFILTGLRGVGKTVLLNEMQRMAEEQHYKTILLEVYEAKPFALLLIPELRNLLYSLDRGAKVGDKVRRGIAVLKSFISSVRISVGDISFGMDIEPEHGAADSGDLEIDLPNLLVAIAEAAEERNAFVAILIDEIQYLASSELSALIMAMHKMQQRRLPLVLIGAGLPILPALAGNSKSYAERLFNFPNIGPLSEVESDKALQDPIEAAQETIAADALHAIFCKTRGYPYFLQEWGYQAWNVTEASPITLDTINHTTALVEERLDKNFFRVRFDRLTPREKIFLRAMADLGAGPYRSADISTKIQSKSTALAPVRANLIKKGMIYSPEHGVLAFTVPLFDGFMRRVIPEFSIA